MTLNDVIDVVTGVLLVSGAFIALVAALGLLRLPEVFSRTHAASKAGVAGSGLALIAIAIHANTLSIWIKGLGTLVFFLITAPIAAHLLAKAAFRSGIRPRDLDQDREN